MTLRAGCPCDILGCCLPPASAGLVWSVVTIEAATLALVVALVLAWFAAAQSPDPSSPFQRSRALAAGATPGSLVRESVRSTRWCKRARDEPRNGGSFRRPPAEKAASTTIVGLWRRPRGSRRARSNCDANPPRDVCSDISTMTTPRPADPVPCQAGARSRDPGARGTHGADREFGLETRSSRSMPDHPGAVQ